ncbi:hypothetical protein MRB53_008991 [Persea americana]|uniref:Uncharacterized protein n=1 Tax=Persea americana TaxID=3435 RepID=A0ACC2LNV2_PERAE|nr:hypothetical protein MRB53_008991 [Persea americana]
MSGSGRALFKSSSFLFPFSSFSSSSSSSSSSSFRFPSRTCSSFSKARMAAESPSTDINGQDPSITTRTPPSPASSAVDFLSLCHRLKTTKRTGWIYRGIQDPESISDHMYRMGIMALVAPDIPGVNRDRCVKMAIVHDIAEAIVGDITPSDGISKSEKSRREQEALDYMCKLLGGGSRATEIAELWKEYEENSSPEAKVVKDFDKVEMILQALEYENEQGKDLDEFFQSTAGKFQTDVGKAWAAEIAARRKRGEH